MATREHYSLNIICYVVSLIKSEHYFLLGQPFCHDLGAGTTMVITMLLVITLPATTISARDTKHETALASKHERHLQEPIVLTDIMKTVSASRSVFYSDIKKQYSYVC